MIDRNVLVDMPTEKIAFSLPNSKGERYVKYLISSSRKGKKHANNKRVTIGIKMQDSDKLCPNRNYFEIFQKTSITRVSPKTIQSFGCFYLLHTLALNCGLLGKLATVFPNIYREIFTMACFMLTEGNAMYYCEDYCDDCYTINNVALIPSTITNLFEKITIDYKDKFFREWLKNIHENECVVYDSTSISTYGNEISQAEYGYNKDKEALPQINLGLYYGQISNLPLFYDVYNGSIRDKEHLIYMKNYAKKYEIEKLTYIMDRGYCKQENLKYLHAEKIPYIMGAPLSLNDIKEEFKLLNVNIKDTINRTTYPSINGVSKAITLFNIPVTLHLYYSHRKEFDEINRIDSDVLKFEEELNELKEKIANMNDKKRKEYDIIDKTKKYKSYFIITVTEDNYLEFSINYSKIDEAKIYCGYFAIISSRLDYDAKTVLILYRQKDGGEKVFDNLKNHIDMNRLRCHSNEVMDGKIFVAFISLILKSLLEKPIRNELSKNMMSIGKIIRELSKIKLTTLYDDQRILMALTSKQKEILSKYNITEDNVKSGANSLLY